MIRRETGNGRRSSRRPQWESEVLVKRFAEFPKPDMLGNPTEERCIIGLDEVTGIRQIGGYPEPYRLEITHIDGNAIVVCGRVSDFVAEFGKVWVDCPNNKCPRPVE